MRANAVKTIGELAQKLLTGLHVPPEMHLFVVLGLVCFVSSAVGFLAGLNMRAKKRRRGAPPSERSFDVDSRISELNRRIRGLVERNELLTAS